MKKSFESSKNESASGFQRLVFALFVAPFYLNDFANIFVSDWIIWLSIDYIFVKLLPLSILLYLIYSKKNRPKDFGLKFQGAYSFCIVFFCVTLSCTVIDQNGYKLISALPSYPTLGGMPAISSSFWNWVDLTLGLFIVGVVEELVFRGYMYTFLRKFTASSILIVMVSSAAFGFIHWSLGLHAVLMTATIGAVFMIAYVKSRTLPPIMLAHFVINFIDFSGIVPKSIFKFV